MLKLNTTRWLALGLALSLGVLGCEPEGNQELEVGEEEISLNEGQNEQDRMGQPGQQGTPEQPQQGTPQQGTTPDAGNQAWSDIDTDSDGALSQEEFQQWWSQANPFQSWDVDGDAELTEDEWSANMNVEFAEVDEDGDGTVQQEELQTGLYAAWDENSDGQLQQEEWHGFDI